MNGLADSAPSPDPLAPAPRPLAVWPAFVLFGLALVIVSAGGFVITAVSVIETISREGVQALRARADSPMELIRAFLATPGVLLASLALTNVVLAALALLAARRSGLGTARALRLRAAGATPATLLLGTLALLGLSDLSDRVISMTNAAEISTIGMIGGAISGASWPAYLLLALLITLAGVSEELFFRGYIQTRLAGRWRRWTAILVTAALFGVMHFDLIHTPFALLAGLCLGWLAERTGSILPPMAAHCCNNLVSALGTRLLASSAFAAAHALMLPLDLVVGLASLYALTRLHPDPRAGRG